MNRDVYLSDNLFEHHRSHDEILAIVAHEIQHVKNFDVYKCALVDTGYMLIYGVGLSIFMQNCDGVLNSFGFTY